MRISADFPYPLARSDDHSRGRAFVEPTGDFASLLMGGAAQNLRYHSGANGPVHSFAQMPMVAPVSEAYSADPRPSEPAASPPCISGAQEEKHGFAGEERSLWRTYDAPTEPLLTCTSAPANGGLFAPARRATQTVPANLAPSLRPEPAAREAKAPAPLTRRIASPARLQLLPFAAHIAQVVSGLTISIRAARMTDGDAHDLKAEIIRLATSFGLAVDSLSITSERRAD